MLWPAMQNLLRNILKHKDIFKVCFGTEPPLEFPALLPPARERDLRGLSCPARVPPAAHEEQGRVGARDEQEDAHVVEAWGWRVS